MSGSFVGVYGDSNFFMKYDTEVRKAYMPGTNVQRLYSNFLERFFIDIRIMKEPIQDLIKKLEDTNKLMSLQLFLPEVLFEDSTYERIEYPVILKIPVRISTAGGCLEFQIALNNSVDKALIKDVQKNLVDMLTKRREMNYEDLSKFDRIISLEDYTFPCVRSFNEMYAIQVESYCRTSYLHTDLYKKEMRFFVENKLKPMIESLMNDTSLKNEVKGMLIPLNKIFICKKGEYPEDLIDFRHEIMIKQTGFSTMQLTHVTPKIRIAIVFGVNKKDKGVFWGKLYENMGKMLKE